MDYVIITDSAANIPTELAQKHGIEIIPFSYFIDGKEHICKDTAKWSCHNYYQKIRDGARVTTSQINPQKYIDFFTPFLKKGKNILFVGLSSGVSGSFASAQIAQKQLSEATGIAQGDISKIENGCANPSLKTIERIAQGMGKKLKLEFV